MKLGMLRFLLVYCVPFLGAWWLWWLLAPDTFIERLASFALAVVAFVSFFSVSDEAWKQTELEAKYEQDGDPRQSCN